MFLLYCSGCIVILLPCSALGFPLSFGSPAYLEGFLPLVVSGYRPLAVLMYISQVI